MQSIWRLKLFSSSSQLLNVAEIFEKKGILTTLASTEPARVDASDEKRMSRKLLYSSS